MPTLYLLFGYPGAGKTSAAKLLQQQTGAVHLSSDELRIQLFPKPSFSQPEHDELYKQLDRRTEELLASGQSVIYDANLNRRQHRQEKYRIASRTGAAYQLLWIQTPRAEARHRATDPSRNHLIVPGETAGQMFDRIADLIEEPTADEPTTIINGQDLSAQLLTKVVKTA
ncbi:MAG: ATP-binding protein [Candidatus Saccharimonadales bacterium]